MIGSGESDLSDDALASAFGLESQRDSGEVRTAQATQDILALSYGIGRFLRCAIAGTDDARKPRGVFIADRHFHPVADTNVFVIGQILVGFTAGAEYAMAAFDFVRVAVVEKIRILADEQCGGMAEYVIDETVDFVKEDVGYVTARVGAFPFANAAREVAGTQAVGHARHRRAELRQRRLREIADLFR